MAFKLVVLLFIGLFFAVFVVENTDPATIRFLGWSANVPLALVILGSLVAGALMVFLLSMIRELGLHSRLWESRRDTRQLSDRVEELEEEVTRHQEEAARLENRVQTLQGALGAAEAEAAALASGGSHPGGEHGDDDGGPLRQGEPPPRG